MSTKEKLHRLVDQLNDDEAVVALELLQVQLGEEPVAWPPEFFGMLRTGQADLAARSSEILREEFGRS